MSILLSNKRMVDALPTEPPHHRSGDAPGAFAGVAGHWHAPLDQLPLKTVGGGDKVFGSPRLSPGPRAVRTFASLSTTTPLMRDVFDVLVRVAATDVTVTLIGETGTGKDVLAHAIHEQSARAAGPFVVFDCGSIAPNLVESELFGHERGSFTGAVGVRAGVFERAHGGTLFLDELGELPLELQPRLLRLLENRRVRRVGGSQELECDVRVIAATNRDLDAEVEAGRFRQDLYFRLAAAVVHVPALRQRLDDVPLLVPRLLAELGRPELKARQATLEALARQAWPGNVRQLKNTLACSIAFVEEGSHHLELHHLRLARSQREAPREPVTLGGQTLRQLEKAAIREALLQKDGNKVDAARSLGIALSTLYEKLKKHEL
jgi:transcriptional regulator with PAS, ATPase and Fis domain